MGWCAPLELHPRFLGANYLGLVRGEFQSVKGLSSTATGPALAKLLSLTALCVLDIASAEERNAPMEHQHQYGPVQGSLRQQEKQNKATKSSKTKEAKTQQQQQQRNATKQQNSRTTKQQQSTSATKSKAAKQILGKTAHTKHKITAGRRGREGHQRNQSKAREGGNTTIHFSRANKQSEGIFAGGDVGVWQRKQRDFRPRTGCGRSGKVPDSNPGLDPDTQIQAHLQTRVRHKHSQRSGSREKKT